MNDYEEMDPRDESDVIGKAVEEEGVLLALLHIVVFYSRVLDGRWPRDWTGVRTELDLRGGIMI